MFAISPSLISTSRSCRKEAKKVVDWLSSHPVRQSPAFVEILNDFENLAILALNEEAWGNTSETPLNVHATERPEVNSWTTHLCRVSCYRSCTAAATHVWGFYSGPLLSVQAAFIFRAVKLQYLKGKSEQQPRYFRQENAMLKNWSRPFD